MTFKFQLKTTIDVLVMFSHNIYSNSYKTPPSFGFLISALGFLLKTSSSIHVKQGQQSTLHVVNLHSRTLTHV